MKMNDCVEAHHQGILLTIQPIGFGLTMPGEDKKRRRGTRIEEMWNAADNLGYQQKYVHGRIKSIGGQGKFICSIKTNKAL